jgi:SAM-dependent methyltransferase
MQELEGKRIADEGIYLDGKDIERPKEIFRFLADIIASLEIDAPLRVLDAGGAGGAYLHYLQSRFPTYQLTGMDVSKALVESALNNVSGCDFYVGSVLDPDVFSGREYDVVNCSGVLSIFDDIELPLVNLLSCVSNGGSLIVNTIINDDPIDVVMRYRRTDGEAEKQWETGWNIFSKQTIERVLEAYDGTLRWSWHSFELPFALEKREDTMRTWTINTEDNPHQLVNGACLLVNMKVLHIVVESQGESPTA